MWQEWVQQATLYRVITSSLFLSLSVLLCNPIFTFLMFPLFPLEIDGGVKRIESWWMFETDWWKYFPIKSWQGYSRERRSAVLFRILNECPKQWQALAARPQMRDRVWINLTVNKNMRKHKQSLSSLSSSGNKKLLTDCINLSLYLIYLSLCWVVLVVVM